MGFSPLLLLLLPLPSHLLFIFEMSFAYQLWVMLRHVRQVSFWHLRDVLRLSAMGDAAACETGEFLALAFGTWHTFWRCHGGLCARLTSLKHEPLG